MSCDSRALRHGSRRPWRSWERSTVSRVCRGARAREVSGVFEENIVLVLATRMRSCGRMLRPGAIAFLKKPLDGSTLLNALNRSMRQG